MNKETRKLIPELRFPEFVNEGEWTIEPLGNLSQEISEKTKGNKYKLMSITSGVGLVSQIEKFGREIAGNSYNNYFVINRGDFAYNKSSTKLYSEGEIAMLENEEQGAVPNSIFTCFRFDNRKILSAFAKYPFTNNIHGKWLRKFIAVGARANGALQVNVRDLFSVPFPYPILKEQQKIASCLSSLDEVITAQTDKLETLKAHKKGLMQNLFPQEGEKVPKYRFKKFEKDGDWMEKKLGQIGNFIGGGTPDTTNKEYWNGDILWFTPTEVKEGSLTDSKRKITDEGLTNSSAKLLPAGALLITTRATIGDVGIATVPCTTNQGFQSLVVNKDQVNLFWYYWLIFNKSELIKRSSGSTFPEIGKNEIVQITALVPLMVEQQKIASCLSSLDALIIAQTKKIEQLKLHKKGLMQGLFPENIE